MSLLRKLDRFSSAGPGSRSASNSVEALSNHGLPSRASVASGTEPEASTRFLSGSDPSDSESNHELPGLMQETAYGPVRVIDTRLEPSHRYGSVLVQSALQVQARTMSMLALDAELCDLDFSKALFLDTETTGLSGGTGTLPFLVGLAWFEDRSLRVHQLFLDHPAHEVSLLHCLLEKLRSCSCIITYNGKSFDWPLLRTRFVMNRIAVVKVPPHLDLLHTGRRVFKRRLGRVRLIDMETHVLGKVREDDVDGSEIPQIYNDFLHEGTTSPLHAVIEHNSNDLIAMAALLARLADHLQVPQWEDDPRDHLGYAQVAERAGKQDTAQLFACASAAGSEPSCVVDAHLLVARTARRSGDRDLEESSLRSALEAGDEARHPFVHLALAKCYEHRFRNYEQALYHAAFTGSAEGAHSSIRRRKRLERKIARCVQPKAVELPLR
ncbi:MAG: ribonuclease H-like domain-containing protein [Myxococcota bacterium]